MLVLDAYGDPGLEVMRITVGIDIQGSLETISTPDIEDFQLGHPHLLVGYGEEIFIEVSLA